MPRFVIVGPLSTGSVTFHVHAEGCQDIATSARNTSGYWTTEYPSASDLLREELEDLNHDGMAYTSEHFKLFPCCSSPIPSAVPAHWSDWLEQAKSAIAQGQSEVAFVLHAHRDNRSLARRAYRAAWRLQQ